MQIIKLDATASTNTYLKELAAAKSLTDFTVVLAKNQTEGRGQRNSAWRVEPGKNLTFSVFKAYRDLDHANAFMLTMAVSLALHRTLEGIGIPRLKIKWPNDIMSGALKLGGILIENRLSGGCITSSVIGIGLNVNQVFFPETIKATSMAKLMDREFDLEVLAMKILKELRQSLDRVHVAEWHSFYEPYASRLFMRARVSRFRTNEQIEFQGVIRGVNREGRLLVAGEDGAVKAYGLKEVRLLL